jgi:ribonuclease D
LNTRFVDTPEGLNRLCEELRDAPFLALDTEFIRETTYHPRLCLVQIASESLAACVDPLALPDPDPLLDLLYRPQVVKVLHSARQDLEIFYDLRGRPPCPVFDTQVAAALLGYGDQVGYANLVEQLLDVKLDKAHTRTDWSARPLSPEQLSYAADDVIHLVGIYLAMTRLLQDSGRGNWLEADFEALCDPATYANPPEEAWRRIRGHHRLGGVQLNVLRALAAWREQQARELNKPRRWVLGDEPLLDLARQQPAKLERMSRIRGLSPGVLRHHGHALLLSIREAKAAPEEQWPQLAAPPRPTPEQEALADLLMAVVRLRGEAQRVGPGNLASRRDLERLACGERDLPLLRGWRRVVAGEAVLDLLEGRGMLGVRDGRPLFTNRDS